MSRWLNVDYKRKNFLAVQLIDLFKLKLNYIKFAWIFLNSIFVNEATDGETTWTKLSVIIGKVAPDNRQVIDDPMLLIVCEYRFFNET